MPSLRLVYSKGLYIVYIHVYCYPESGKHNIMLYMHACIYTGNDALGSIYGKKGAEGSWNHCPASMSLGVLT